jgi:cytoskeletal protein RodZ
LTIGQLKFEVAIKQDKVVEEKPKIVDLQSASEKVAASTGSDDLDVLELFKSDSSPSMRDTVRLETSETIATTRESLIEPNAAASEPEDEEPAARARPAAPRQQHKDGGEAAAQALRQFLKGR